jgi:hypothetical protein
MTALSRAARAVILFAFALLTWAQPHDAHAARLFETSFVPFDPFSTDTDPNSDATLVKWSYDDRGINAGEGNPQFAMFGATTYSSVGDARTNDQVWRISLTPHSGYALDLTSISFDLAAGRSGTATTAYTAQAWVYSNLDLQATPIAAGFATDTTADSHVSAYTTWTFDLSTNPLFQNVTAPMQFSFYITGTDAASHAYFDNVHIDGDSVAVVPEPSTVLCVAVGAAVCGVPLLRRRKRTTA